MTEEDNKYIQKESPSITDGGESKGGGGGGANQKHNRGGLSICGGRNRTGGGSVPIPKLTFKRECRATEDTIFHCVGPHQSDGFKRVADHVG